MRQEKDGEKGIAGSVVGVVELDAVVGVGEGHPEERIPFGFLCD